MSLTLQIVIIIVVLLVAALVILTVFGVKLGDVGDVLSKWLGFTGNAGRGCPATAADAGCNLFAGCQPCGDACTAVGQCDTT